MMLLAAVVVTALPFGAVVALLLLAQHVQRRHAERAARQVAVTDAIHQELGAAVAPTLTKPVLRPWRLVISVPFDRPALVAGVLAVAQTSLARFASPYQIVLVPRR